MTASRMAFEEQHVLAKEHLPELIGALQDAGYRVVAPVEREGVLALHPIESVSDAARGLRDQQSPGHYRLEHSAPGQYFENVVGPESGKRWFFPARHHLFSMRVEEGDFVLQEAPAEAESVALLGLRACDLAAIAIQDRVFDGDAGGHATFRCESETHYLRARERSFLIAVDCTRPGGNCFCESWGTGPTATDGFDLALTELSSSFLVRAGSSAGETILERIPTRSAGDAEVELAELKRAQAREHMGRRLETEGLAELIADSVDSHVFEEIGERCLGCGNCTLVCPTCFCSTVTDGNDLASGAVSRTRSWESCFTHQFSYVTSGAVRSSTSARYRHWLTHKLSSWWEQFGTSGCVGCGRCITWCPVAIDWTRDVAQLQKDERSRRRHEEERRQEVVS